MKRSRSSSLPLRPASIAVLAGLLLAAPARGQCVPEIVGSVETTRATGVAVSGTHAYVVDGESSLHVVDVSDAANPAIVGSVDVEAPRGVAVAGAVAYVIETSDLQVIDASVPTNPTIIASVALDFFAFDVAVSAGFVYVVGVRPFDTGRMDIIDVSDPMNPIALGSFSSDLSSLYMDVAVAGDLAYVADGALRVFDVSDPANPTLIASLEPLGALSVDVSGDRAYVLDAGFPNDQMRVIDVSDPENPAIIGSVELRGFSRDVAVTGGEAYVAGNGAELQIVDVSAPSNPTLLGSLLGHALAIAVSGGTAYVGADDSGLHVVDLSTCDRGACCLTQGCLELTSTTCASVSGTYLGDLSTCATGVCPLPCPADLSDNGAVDFQDILAVLKDWCPCP